MDSSKYIGMDVHLETISMGVMNSAGKVVAKILAAPWRLPLITKGETPQTAATRT
jgi:hypothetical protein